MKPLNFRLFNSRRLPAMQLIEHKVCVEFLHISQAVTLRASACAISCETAKARRYFMNIHRSICDILDGVEKLCAVARQLTRRVEPIYDRYLRCPRLIPSFNAFWRNEPSVLFVSFMILTNGVLAFE
ncbi:hypothetical protein [Bradyrhizobium sp. URHD0069]|uniref:hypothetical protein n=1 Tax=Bradyrhizobium sp. URHD0069 TaxID=1380355 RepID=UPI0004984BC7|nr:hypothetical protein [Bradyrhizobium sp. URHD0069]